MKRQFLLIILIGFMFSGMFAAEKDRLAVMDVSDEAGLFKRHMLFCLKNFPNHQINSPFPFISR